MRIPRHKHRENMSFGQHFAYSKTKEQDVALMLAANVFQESFLRFRCIGSRRYWELLKLDGSIHLQEKPRRSSHHQRSQVMGKAHDCRQNHCCHPQPKRHLGKSNTFFVRIWFLPIASSADLARQGFAGGVPSYRSFQTENSPKEPSLSSLPTPRPTISEENGLQVLLPTRTQRSKYSFILNLSITYLLFNI